MVYEIEISDEELLMRRDQTAALYQLQWIFADTLEKPDNALLKIALDGLHSNADAIEYCFTKAAEIAKAKASKMATEPPMACSTK